MEYLEIPAEIIQNLNAFQAWHYKILPKKISNNILTLYIGKSQSHDIKPELQILIGKKIQFEVIEDIVLSTALSRYYRREDISTKGETFHIQSEQADDFLIKLVNEAQQSDSSDIHIEPYEMKSRIRFRIDGVLIERYTIPKEDYPSLVNKIKIKSSLDISEKRLPQDGRFLLKSGTQKLDLRVSILPTMFGEKIVLRLLNSDIYSVDISRCGFNDEQMDIYQKAVLKPNGIVLISGPTGSGKTTTLYSTLKLLNKPERNIITIEDPIEYTLEGINQVQLKESIGLTFPKALRTFLRQDPDIIMVGEIRDRETAEMAIRASLTGHLVLSTIHTNSALGTINRLIDMGVPSFLIADTLNLSVAQRLVRLLCNNCKAIDATNAGQTNKLAEMTGITLSTPVYKAHGCSKCYYTGYKGRSGLFEIIEMSDEVKQAIRTEAVKPENIKYSKLRDAAYKMVLDGITSIEEVTPILLS